MLLCQLQIMNFLVFLCKCFLQKVFSFDFFVFDNRLEATYCGCFPLVPNRLVYPEIYPECCLYESCDDLFQRLTSFCLKPSNATAGRESLQLDLQKYSACKLLPEYVKLFAVL